MAVGVGMRRTKTPRGWFLTRQEVDDILPPLTMGFIEGSCIPSISNVYRMVVSNKVLDSLKAPLSRSKVKRSPIVIVLRADRNSMCH